MKKISSKKEKIENNCLTANVKKTKKSVFRNDNLLCLLIFFY